MKLHYISEQNEHLRSSNILIKDKVSFIRQMYIRGESSNNGEKLKSKTRILNEISNITSLCPKTISDYLNISMLNKELLEKLVDNKSSSVSKENINVNILTDKKMHGYVYLTLELQYQ